ncbi:MAG: 4-hydroxybenzoate 3-monooxygenase [Alphaproteobacteria bacterium]
MSSELNTTVAIIGAGPAGLLLSQLLHQSGINSIIVERTSKERVLERIRAGILERGTVEGMEEAGCAERLHAECIPHDGVILSFDGDLCEIPVKDITGHNVIVYGQTEITKDLIEACEARGQQIFWECPDAVLADLETDAPKVRFTDTSGDTMILTAEVIAGCDGFHGVSRQSIPQARRREFERTYPFGWLGILVDEPPVAHNVIYANHQDGFALASMRSETRSRYYVQSAPGETVDDWSTDRFWDAFTTRLGELGKQVKIGEPIEKSIAPLRSYVSEPMRFGRLFLGGDSAHIVPPTGAKGLNLAFADVRRLSRAIAQWKNKGSDDALERYSIDALARVWKIERFSWYLTTMMHQFPEHTGFEKRMQRAEFDYIRGSEAGQVTIAENYVGLPF